MVVPSPWSSKSHCSWTYHQICLSQVVGCSCSICGDSTSHFNFRKHHFVVDQSVTGSCDYIILLLLSDGNRPKMELVVDWRGRKCCVSSTISQNQMAKSNQSMNEPPPDDDHMMDYHQNDLLVWFQTSWGIIDGNRNFGVCVVESVGGGVVCPARKGCRWFSVKK